MATQAALDQNASNLESQALQYRATGMTLEDKLKDALAKRFQNNPIQQQRDAAMGDVLTAGERGREEISNIQKGGTILAPTQQSRILATKEASSAIPLASLNQLLSSFYGSVGDTVGATSKAYQADGDLLLQQAELARKRADTSYDRSIKERELALKSGKEAGNPLVALAYIEQLKNGSIKNFSQIPSEDRGLVVQLLSSMGTNVNELARSREGKQVSQAVQSLYDLYYGKPGEQDDLAGGRAGGTLSKIASFFGMAPRTRTYQNTKDGILANLKQITGDTGILTDTDAQRLSGLLADPTATPEEANLAWGQINNLLLSKYGISLNEDPDFEVLE